MIQNVSQNRSDKKITRRDCNNVACVAFHPYYGGTLEQYKQDNSSLPASLMQIYYIQGVGNNKAVIKWALIACGVMNPANKNGYQNEILTKGQSVYGYFDSRRFVMGQEYEQGYIHKDLHLNIDEVKIMIDVSFMGHHCIGMSGQKRLPPKFWGTILYSPQADEIEGHRTAFFHNTYVIFTPKPGLFSETPPQ